MSNSVIIVTGASRGIGKSIARLAVRDFGANLVAVARSAAALEELRMDLVSSGHGDKVEIIVGDLTEEGTSVNAVSKAINKWGRLDGIVANAGILAPLGKIADSSFADWKTAFNINFLSVIFLVQRAIPYLRESKGSIVLISSGAAVNPYSGWAAYCSSKAALIMLGRSLALEEPDIVTISVRPGVVDTEMQALIRNDGKEGMTADKHKYFVDLHESGKLLHPDDPGYVCAALAVGAPRQLSGEMISWNDEKLAAFQKK